MSKARAAAIVRWQMMAGAAPGAVMTTNARFAAFALVLSGQIEDPRHD